MRIAFAISMLLFLAGSKNGFAQQVQDVIDRNDELKCGLSSPLAPGANVSGTNVNLTFLTSCTGLADYGGSDGWTSRSVDKLEVVLPDGGSVSWSPPPIFAGVISKTLRIASTHFADGGTITFTVKANWTLSRTGETKTVNMSKVVTLTAYNKAITLATVEVWLTDHYSKPGDADYPSPAHVPETSLAGMTVGRPILAGSEMNHTLWPTALSDTQTWRESTGTWRLDQKLKEATLLFAFTHGETSLFRASESDELSFQTGVYSEVHGYAIDSRTVPDSTLPLCTLVPSFTMTIRAWPGHCT